MIYTVRRDHLVPRLEDEFGVFRVHFDLLMKNVIDWTDPGDALFAARLGRRIDEVLGPVRARMKVDEEAQRELDVFLALSHEERKSALLAACSEVATSVEIGASIAEIKTLIRNVTLFAAASRC